MKIMVYGTLKRGYWNNRLLDGAMFIGEALTNKPYTMTGNGIPFIHPNKEGLPVKGEVYEIDVNKHLHNLDRLEGHPHTYTRTTIDVQMLDCGTVHKADIYEMLHHRGSSPHLPPNKDYYEWSSS